jgi:hypothetical protein
MKAPVFILIIFFLIGSSCGSGLHVTTDSDKTADFTQYKTFSFYKLSDSAQALSELNKERIVKAIRSALANKGYSESGTPDFVVNAVAIVKHRQSVSSNTDYYSYGGYYRPYNWGAGMGVSSNTTYNVQNYKDGSLIIDIIDAGKKQLIWQGIGNKDVEKPLKDPETQIPELISKILADFPPGATKK